MKLNELTPGLADKIAPTDCRLRPDQRATEEGYYDKVAPSPSLAAPLALLSWQTVLFECAAPGR